MFLLPLASDFSIKADTSPSTAGFDHDKPRKVFWIGKELYDINHSRTFLVVALSVLAATKTESLAYHSLGGHTCAVSTPQPRTGSSWPSPARLPSASEPSLATFPASPVRF